MNADSFNDKEEYSDAPLAKVLTIEDDELVRQSFVMFLEDYGYEVIEAADGSSGLSAFREQGPDLVLCDIRMPNLNGMEVLKTITEESPSTPVIMISGAGMMQDVVESLRMGAFDYLVKPVAELELLANAVERALQKKHLEAENSRVKGELEAANQELEVNLSLLQQDQDAGRRTQMQMLPEPDVRYDQYHFSHVLFPSLNVSGDFLDHFRINDRYIGFYIADVSGHGSASALITMLLKSLFNQPLKDYRAGVNQIIIEPGAMLEYLNSEVLEANLGKHIAIFYGVLDLKHHHLLYAIAGQYPRPIIFHLGERRPVTQRGLPVGMFEWADYETFSTAFPAQQSLLLCSDGLLQDMGDEIAVSEDFLLDIDFQTNWNASSLAQSLNIGQKGSVDDDISIFLITRHGEEQ